MNIGTLTPLQYYPDIQGISETEDRYVITTKHSVILAPKNPQDKEIVFNFKKFKVTTPCFYHPTLKYWFMGCNNTLHFWNDDVNMAHTKFERVINIFPVKDNIVVVQTNKIVLFDGIDEVKSAVIPKISSSGFIQDQILTQTDKEIHYYDQKLHLIKTIPIDLEGAQSTHLDVIMTNQNQLKSANQIVATFHTPIQLFDYQNGHVFIQFNENTLIVMYGDTIVSSMPFESKIVKVFMTSQNLFLLFDDALEIASWTSTGITLLTKMQMSSLTKQWIVQPEGKFFQMKNSKEPLTTENFKSKKNPFYVNDTLVPEALFKSSWKTLNELIMTELVTATKNEIISKFIENKQDKLLQLSLSKITDISESDLVSMLIYFIESSEMIDLILQYPHLTDLNLTKQLTRLDIAQVLTILNVIKENPTQHVLWIRMILDSHLQQILILPEAIEAISKINGKLKKQIQIDSNLMALSGGLHTLVQAKKIPQSREMIEYRMITTQLNID